jgi:hypothetical protein
MKPLKKITLFILMISFVLCSIGSVNVTAASTPSYSQLRLIHGSSSTDQSILNDIKSISASTGKSEQNGNGEWLNPFVYRSYGIIAYGLPSGDYFETQDGKTNKGGVKGEYKYIGESEGRDPFVMTNDRYFSGGSPGNKFMSVADYKRISWQTLSGASDSWSNLLKDQRDVIANHNFSDDDYGGPVNSDGEIDGLTLYGLLGDNIRNKALVQVAPTMWSVNGSVRLKYDNINWNTVIFRPLAPETEVSATIDSENVFVMEENMDSITVPYTVNGIIKGDAVTQGMMQNLDRLSFYSNLIPKDISLTASSSSTQKAGFEKKFSRAALKVGNNTKELSGVVNLTTKYPTDSPLRTTAAKNITIIVKPKKVAPTDGVIFVRYMNYNDNSEISETAQEFVCSLGVKKTIYGSSPPSGYETCKGSFKIYYPDTSSTVTPPAKNDIKPETSQDVTLSAAQKVAYVYFWYTPKPGDPEKPPTRPPEDTNAPPVAIIKNPPIAYAGDDVKYDGSLSWDSDGTVERYFWDTPDAAVTIDDDSIFGYTWYSAIGKYPIKLWVVDDDGGSGETESTIQIIEPKPEISIDILADKMKENRKITLDTSKSKSAARFPIDWSRTTWKIEPIQASGATGDYGVRLENGTVYKNANNIAYLYNNGSWSNTGIDFNSILKGQKTFQFQTRDSGQYKITVSMTNTSIFNSAIHYSNTLDRTITVIEDLAPIANFSGSESNIREYENPTDKSLHKYGIIPVTCTSASPDGDPIGKRLWALRYDSDNDRNNGLSMFDSYNDETTIYYPYTGNSSDPFTSGIRLVVNGEYASAAEIWTYEVGKYTEALQVFEDIPESETVKELLLPTDFLSAYVQGW